MDNFKPLKTLSIFTVIAFGIMMLLSFIFFVLSIGNIFAPTFYIGEVSGWLGLIGITMILRFPIFILTAILFLIWLNRANKNLTPLKAENIEFSSGWAVGWWFIPFANLVKPFQVVREVWCQSDPDFDESLGFLPNSYQAPTFMTLWWACWLISNILLQIFDKIDSSDRTMSLPSSIIMILSSLCAMIAAFLVIKIVRGITERQNLRFNRLQSTDQGFVPPPPPTFN